MKREILLLGDPRLYEVSEPVQKEELEELKPIIEDMFDTIKAFRSEYGFGRAIAAPQIGLMKRLICAQTDRAYVMINPVLEPVGEETMELMDNCMSFPGLEVRVNRAAVCRVRYMDEDWQEKELLLEGDMSELIQHEYDHLDGILAVMRASDDKSLYYRTEVLNYRRKSNA